MNTNVKIPLDLLKKIIYLLEYINVDEPALKNDLENILFALYKKMESLALRDSYAKIIYAKDEDARHLAKMSYLQQKRAYKEDF